MKRSIGDWLVYAALLTWNRNLRESANHKSTVFIQRHGRSDVDAGAIFVEVSAQYS
jgi:hypothetical protein